MIWRGSTAMTMVRTVMTTTDIREYSTVGWGRSGAGMERISGRDLIGTKRRGLRKSKVMLST